MLWRWLIRLCTRLRPREGWLVFILTLGAVVTVPAAVQGIGWVPGLGRLLPVAIVAVLFGLLLARSPFSGRMSAFFSLIVGVEFVVGFIGRVLPPFRPMLSEAVYAIRWLYALTHGVVGRVPFLPVLEVWWQRAWDFWMRLSVWAQGVSQGGAQQDNLLFLFFCALTVWGMAAWAGWWVFRHHQGLVALLPSGVGLATNLFFAREGEAWAISFVGMLLLLLVGLRRYTLEQAWTWHGLDYSEEIRTELYVTGVIVSAVILILMPLVPTITSRRMADMFWDLFSSPWRRVEESAERMFPELERPAVSPLRVGLGGSPSQLPRVHLLGGSVELGRRVALRVRLNQPPPQFGGEKRYYRAITYADYSGRGWSNQDELETRDFPPGEPWDDTFDVLPGRKRLLQAITLLDAPGGVLYAVGEPMAPDVPYQARLRGSGDLVSITTEGRLQRYSMLSMVPAVSEKQLRAADRDYPDHIRAHYLSLPEIPQRVLDKAAEVVAGADNPYDQAVAIETYLRGFEYTLEIGEPPPDRDVVDYFLFDLQKGYCDYYASAMVVMARAVGIPARLAVGYASGYYDEHADEYTVTEAEAHSWPELYFPPYGWIPFEPTASRSTFERIGLPEAGEIQPGADVNQSLQELQRWNPWPRQWLIRFGALGLAFVVAGIGYLAWMQYQRRTLGPVMMAYASLVWWGKRLGGSHSLAETPHEHAHTVARQMERIAQAAHRGRRWLQRWRNAALADLTAIAEAYTEEMYAANPLADAKRRQVGTAWRRLRGKLWAFWIARRL